MLERMRAIKERMDQIRSSFSGLTPRRRRSPEPTFQSAVQDALNPRDPVPPFPVSGAATEPTVGAAQALALTKRLTPFLPTAPGQPFGGVAPAGAMAPAMMAAVKAGLPGSEFNGLIEKHARQNKLDPALIRRLIEVESGFDPQAQSRRGAMGLMQLMPETARDLGVTNPFDPGQNIAAGTKYLSQLLSQQNGDLRRALAAYNAGPTTVRLYGGIPPFPETRHFVAKVMESVKPAPGDR
jgi:soluble lytic murein transglycosylase-like protein